MSWAVKERVNVWKQIRAEYSNRNRDLSLTSRHALEPYKGGYIRTFIYPLACTLCLNVNVVSPPYRHGLTMRNKKENTFVLKICSSGECSI
jgi:hypothetical protein